MIITLSVAICRRARRGMYKTMTAGRCEHEVVAQKEPETMGDHTYEKGVHLFNNDDGFYYQVFENWEEIKEFISKLHTAAYEVWGPERDE